MFYFYYSTVVTATICEDWRELCMDTSPTSVSVVTTCSVATGWGAGILIGSLIGLGLGCAAGYFARKKLASATYIVRPGLP